jgi:hypothetical protein
MLFEAASSLLHPVVAALMLGLLLGLPQWRVLRLYLPRASRQGQTAWCFRRRAVIVSGVVPQTHCEPEAIHLSLPSRPCCPVWISRRWMSAA